MNSALIYPVKQSGPEILKLADVRVRFPVSNDWLGRPRGYAHALNGIDLQVRAGETLGIVGESGCGKSTLAQLLMGLLKPSSGELSWANGSKGEGSSNVQIVFQDPQSSLNPRLPIWRIIAVRPRHALARTNAQHCRQSGGPSGHSPGISGPFRPPVFRRATSAHRNCPGTVIRPGHHRSR